MISFCIPARAPFVPRRIVAPALATLLCLPLAADTITVGEPFEGNLSGAAATHEIEVTAGETLLIRATEANFPMALSYEGPDGAEEMDLFRGEPLYPQMIITPETSGTATLRVMNRQGQAGTYILMALPYSPTSLSDGGETELGLTGGPNDFVFNAESPNMILHLEGTRSALHMMRLQDSEGGLRFGRVQTGPQPSELIIDGLASGPVHLTLTTVRGSSDGPLTASVMPLAAQETITLTHDGESETMGSVPLEGLTVAEGSALHTVSVQVPRATRLQIEVTSDDIEPMVTLITPSAANGNAGTDSVTLHTSLFDPGELLVVIRDRGGATGGTFDLQVTDLGVPRMPDFSLTDLDGQTLTSADLEGQVALINFWATWCGPCVREMPHFVEVAEEYADRGVRIVGISRDNPSSPVDDPDAVAAFAEENEINYPLLMDAQSRATIDFGRLTDEGQIEAIPTTFVVDQAGAIRGILRGYQEKHSLVEAIEPLLAEN